MDVMDKKADSQSFGSVWTATKLKIIDDYLNFYVTALKKQKFKLCYIDAFARSGKVRIKTGDEVDGSAIRALKYGFDRFYFFEKDQSYYQLLQQRIEKEFWNLSKKVTLLKYQINIGHKLIKMI
jgi:three-Cys-motif partner protein